MAILSRNLMNNPWSDPLSGSLVDPLRHSLKFLLYLFRKSSLINDTVEALGSEMCEMPFWDLELVLSTLR